MHVVRSVPSFMMSEVCSCSCSGPDSKHVVGPQTLRLLVFVLARTTMWDSDSEVVVRAVSALGVRISERRWHALGVCLAFIFLYSNCVLGQTPLFFPEWRLPAVEAVMPVGPVLGDAYLVP